MHKLIQIAVALLLGIFTAVVFVIGLGFFAVISIVALISAVLMKRSVRDEIKQRFSQRVRRTKTTGRVIEGNYKVVDNQ